MRFVARSCSSGEQVYLFERDAWASASDLMRPGEFPFALFVAERETQLDPRGWHGVPAGETMGDARSGQAEILGAEGPVGGWVVQDRLGVNARLVGECEPGDGSY